jgi:hypothetical protein
VYPWYAFWEWPLWQQLLGAAAALLILALCCGQVMLCCRNCLRDNPAQKGPKKKRDLCSSRSGKGGKRKVKPDSEVSPTKAAPTTAPAGGPATGTGASKAAAATTAVSPTA